MKIVATYSIKGGVGKTTAAVNLAAEAAARGWQVLLWDLDPQGGATYVFRTRSGVTGGAKGLLSREQPLDDVIVGTDVPNLDLLPSDFQNRTFDALLSELKRPNRRLGKVVAPAADAYDFLVLDCAPGASLIGESILAAADALVVPVIPSALSVRTLDQLTAFIEESELDPPQVIAFLSMVDRRRRLHRDLAESLPETRDEVVAIDIPYSSSVERMGDRREPLREYARTSRASRAYAELWAVIEDRLG